METLLEHPVSLVSAFVCVLLVVGVLNRGKKRVHIPLMISALAIDLAMVLYLEIRRGVVESIPQREMTTLLILHLALSTVVLALYAVQVVTGVRKARGGDSAWHFKVAFVFLVARFGNLITAFLVAQGS